MFGLRLAIPLFLIDGDFYRKIGCGRPTEMVLLLLAIWESWAIVWRRFRPPIKVDDPIVMIFDFILSLVTEILTIF
jgi:hypothetical protein